MLIPRLGTLALTIAATLAIAGAADSTTREISVEGARAISERVDLSREAGSLRAIDAPAPVAALAASPPTVSQGPSGRSTPPDLRGPSPGAIDAWAARFGVRRPGADPATTRPGPAYAQRDRLLRYGAISSYSTSLPPPSPHA